MKVKVIKANLPTYWYADRVGEVFEVSQSSLGSFYKLTGDPEAHRVFDLDDVEIVKDEKQMKKSDLRTGDLIVLSGASGSVRVYKDTEQGDIVAGNTWYPLKDYSDDRLFNWTTESIYGDQFLEVWRPKSNSTFAKAEPSEFTHTLIWKKEQQTPEQKQLQEVMTKISELQEQAEKLQKLVQK